MIEGLIVGLLLGFIIRRGFFCMYNGFANMVISRDYRVIKAAIWAFLATMLGFHVLSSLGVIALNPKPFFWAASIIGAVLFSVGMVLSGSCIVGTPLRAASGKIGYWLTLLGMAIGGWSVIWGPLTSYRVFLQESTKVMLNGKSPTLDALLGVNHWVVVMVLSALSVYLLIRLKSKKEVHAVEDQQASAQGTSIFSKIFKTLWAPAVVGVSLGALEMIAFLTGKSPAGLGGFIKGYASYFKALFTGSLPFDWPVAEITGILLGVFVSAVIAGEFRIVWPKAKRIPALFVGGLLMGVGAVTAAGGCNVAHIISHMPQLSIGSFVSGFTIIFSTTLLVYLIFVRRKSS
ncbi:YeeE/YedE family protein [Patescibacteria group bacterium]|nr:YeeE/YedE family protein [Patescibacteria group bacterium]